MIARTKEGHIIRGTIDDKRLRPGMPRMRGGSVQMFGPRTRDQECDFTIEPPNRSWYAEEVNGVWMWVEGCDHCNGGKLEQYCYMRCIDHDVCQGCRVDRVNAVKSQSKFPGGGECVWGWPGGWLCDPCHTRHVDAITAAAEARIDPDYDESDSEYLDNAECPWCRAKVCTDEQYGADGEVIECDECQRVFTLTACHSVSWTTVRK